MNEKVEEIISQMLVGEHPEIQRIQTAHRLRIVEEWGIYPVEKILEIGCGQGDTTAVLADAVGLTGQIVAIDIAHEIYGGPNTIGESMKKLQQSSFGSVIQFFLEKNILKDIQFLQGKKFNFEFQEEV